MAHQERRGGGGCGATRGAAAVGRRVGRGSVSAARFRLASSVPVRRVASLLLIVFFAVYCLNVLNRLRLVIPTEKDRLLIFIHADKMYVRLG